MDEVAARCGMGSGDLAEALDAGQLRIVYQPKVCVASNRLIGAEALARWQHPLLGAIQPSIFVPLAEDGELIHPFTEWVVATAVADWAAWARRGVHIPIAINVSARNLSRIDLPDMVAACCRSHGMPHEQLTIELTESATEDAIFLLDTLSRFRIKRFGVSIDDFGTGHSSLSRLARLPFSEVKIDRSFVSAMDFHEEKRIEVQRVIGLAHDLGLTVVAEGVETRTERDMLAMMGCDTAQGYYFAAPLEADQLPDWSPPA